MDRVNEAFNGPGKVYATEQDAKHARDTRAKDLRAQGYIVKCAKFDFSDLARAVRFTLDARKD
jgi:hypothetical protein